MDVKNCMDRYRETTGCSHIDIEKIRESIYLIKGCGIDYEFRTTVVKELHSDENMVKLGSLFPTGLSRKRRGNFPRIS